LTTPRRICAERKTPARVDRFRYYASEYPYGLTELHAKRQRSEGDRGSRLNAQKRRTNIQSCKLSVGARRGR
jgi:hypothetical protein